MPMTEAQRRANQKWDRNNNAVLSCKLRKEKAEAFKAACYANGTTPNAVMTAAMQAFMQSHDGWDYWMQKVQETTTE